MMCGCLLICSVGRHCSGPQLYAAHIPCNKTHNSRKQTLSRIAADIDHRQPLLAPTLRSALQSKAPSRLSGHLLNSVTPYHAPAFQQPGSAMLLQDRNVIQDLTPPGIPTRRVRSPVRQNFSTAGRADGDEGTDGRADQNLKQRSHQIDN